MTCWQWYRFRQSYRAALAARQIAIGIKLCHRAQMGAATGIERASVKGSLPLTCQLTAPFRTLININSEQAAADPATAAALFVDAAAKVQAASDWDVQTPWENLQRGFRRYATISDDYVSLFARPLFIIRPPADRVAAWETAAREALAKALGRAPDAVGVRINRAEFRLFDNTIGVASIALTAHGKTRHKNFLADALVHFDHLSDVLSAQLVETATPVAQMLVKALAEVPASRRRHRDRRQQLVRRGGQFLSFADLNDFADNLTGAAKDGGSGVDLHLWTNRILFVPAAAFEPGLCEAIRRSWKVPVDDQVPLPHVDDLSARINIGNSVFVGSIDRFAERGLPQTMAAAQFFYAQLDVLKHNMSALYAELYEYVPMKHFRQMRERISRTNSQVNFILSELSDYRLGVQGTRKWYFDALYDCFLFDLLIDSVRQKQQTVQERAADLQARLFARIDGFIEALIFFLGAVTLIDITLALLGLAKGSDHSISGPSVEYRDGALALLRSLPSDLVLSIITLIVLLFLGLFVLRRRQ